MPASMAAPRPIDASVAPLARNTRGPASCRAAPACSILFNYTILRDTKVRGCKPQRPRVPSACTRI